MKNISNVGMNAEQQRAVAEMLESNDPAVVKMAKKIVGIFRVSNAKLNSHLHGMTL